MIKMGSVRNWALAGTTAAAALAASAAMAATVYEYDELGRLKKVTYDNGATITYTYDASGNRTQLVETD